MTGVSVKACRSLIRRFCFALVTARTLAFAVAPVMDLQILPPAGAELAVVASPDGDPHEVALHDPATCAICALLHDAPWVPPSAEPSHGSFAAERASVAVARAAERSAPVNGFLSRAPPRTG